MLAPDVLAPGQTNQLPLGQMLPRPDINFVQMIQVVLISARIWLNEDFSATWTTTPGGIVRLLHRARPKGRQRRVKRRPEIHGIVRRIAARIAGDKPMRDRIVGPVGHCSELSRESPGLSRTFSVKVAHVLS